MFFKRNDLDAMLNGFVAGRSKSKFMPYKGAICEICGLDHIKSLTIAGGVLLC